MAQSTTCNGPHHYVEKVMSGPGVYVGVWICRDCGHPLHPKSKLAAEYELNTLKGEKNGFCNRSSCLKPGANYYNHSTRKYYCEECATVINNVNRKEAMELFGHDLCTLN